jgi:8-amino-7-oxononanoate synthase
MRLGRATAVAARHNDVQSFADAVAGWRAAGNRGRAWIAVESLYSMDGDLAPLAGLAELADREEAFLLIDEAHATGVFGPAGRGLAHALEGRENVVTLRTCGKALGCEGALVCCPRVIADMLVNKARGFIFSTAPSPLMAALVRASLRLVAAEPRRQERLARLVAFAGTRLPRSGSQILPIVIGEEARTMDIAAALQRRGHDVRGIRPPTVPNGTSRLRVSLTLNVDEEVVADLADTVTELLS